MHYIVFDLEWNQAPNEESVITDPFYLAGEIVQIGAVKLDASFQTVDELRLLIRPQYYTRMHRRIASLTGIRDKDLQEKGVPFPEAFRMFMDWAGEEFAYMTWSRSDLPMLIDNMLLHGIDASRLPVTYDIQRMFSREIMRADRQFSLNDAIKILGERGDIAHDALHDARNTVKVCAHLDLEVFAEEYAAMAFAQPPVNREYPDLSSLLQDRELLRFRCPWCGAESSCQGWLPLDTHEHMAMGICPEEQDEFLMTLSTQRRGNGALRASRVMYEMSDDLWEIWQAKNEAALPL